MADASATRVGFGMGGWCTGSWVGEFSGTVAPAVAPPPPTVRGADEIDFRIMGHEMQYVEVELDPGESAVVEAGVMMYKAPSIQMESVFGDGSFMGKLMGAGKRLLTGEGIFFAVLRGPRQGVAPVAALLAPRRPDARQRPPARRRQGRGLGHPRPR